MVSSRSKLRKAADLEVSHPKYAGKKASRKDLFEDDDGDQEGSEEEEDDGEEEGEEVEEDDEDLQFDYDDLEESANKNAKKTKGSRLMERDLSDENTEEEEEGEAEEDKEDEASPQQSDNDEESKM